MGKEYIKVQSLTLRELFSGSYCFQLPWFQRAYAWQTDQVSQLLGDLLSALEAHGANAEYFLGTILISKPNDSSETSLIDGHQRTMTLTILFSVMRDLCEDPKIKQELGNLVRTTDFHLRPQNTQADFCIKHVQLDGATALEPEDLFESLSTTEQNILTCRDHIRERLLLNNESIAPLTKFLADHCHVIVHEAPDEDQAWARLRKEEETRLDFSKVDLAKDSLLSIVSSNERTKCAEIWEDVEALIGPNDLFGLLCHLRTLKNKKVRNKPLEEEIAKAFELDRNGLNFMADVLRPAAQDIKALRIGSVGSKADRPRIAELCSYMNWLDRQRWMPPALAWLRQYGHDHPDTLKFFTALERLFWILSIVPDGSDKLPKCLLEIVQQIERETPIDRIKVLKIDKKLKTVVLDKLRAQYFDRKSKRAEIMRRIAAAVGQDPGPIDGLYVTVEHVLPRGWKPKNHWRTLFPGKQEVLAHAHKLGNLTYLSSEHNALADSSDFARKREIYAISKFDLSRELAKQTNWTAADIDARTERLIEALFAEWDLSLT